MAKQEGLSGTEDRATEKLTREIKQFVHDRDWEQFHDPKNLSMALMVEAAELAEHFQWLTPEQSSRISKAKYSRLQDEIGDVLIYLIELADILGIELLRAAERKLKKNARKYPKERVRGKALKCWEYR